LLLHFLLLVAKGKTYIHFILLSMWHLFDGCAFFLSAWLGVVLSALVSADTKAREAHGITGEQVSLLPFTPDRRVIFGTRGNYRFRWEPCWWDETGPYRED
jgi:hypothetical protein